MNQKEFENRTGIRITADEYARVEQAYMGLPDSVDKDKFCKIWLKEGGVQSILDNRMVASFPLHGRIEELEEEVELNKSEVKYWHEMADRLEKENKALKEMVKTIKGLVAA